MKKISSKTLTLVAPLALLCLALVLVAGCGQKTAKLMADQNKAFDSAPAEVKQTWKNALAADKANDYVAAAASLDSLKKMILSDEQGKVLEAERDAFGQRLIQAIDKNNPSAIQAVKNSQKARTR